MSRLVLSLALLVATLGAACARPQQSAPTAAAPASPSASPPAGSSPTSRITGVVQGVNGSTVLLQDGEQFPLGPDARIIRSVPVDPATVQSGDFVAVTAKRQADGMLLASIVNILPESMRGLGVGQRPMDDGNLMTNATVGDVSPSLMTNATVNDVGNAGFSVQFPGGNDEVELADGAQVNQFQAASVGDLAPGTSVSAFVSNGAAQFITIM